MNQAVSDHFVLPLEPLSTLASRTPLHTAFVVPGVRVSVAWVRALYMFTCMRMRNEGWQGAILVEVDLPMIP